MNAPKNLRDACATIEQMLIERETTNALLKDFERRLELVEKDQGWLAKRDPPRIPKFPKILREMGIVPPEERVA